MRNEGRNLRNFNEFYVPLARSEQVKKLTLFSLPKIWNSLPDFKLNPLVPDHTLKSVFSKTSFRYFFSHNTAISYPILKI